MNDKLQKSVSGEQFTTLVNVDEIISAEIQEDVVLHEEEMNEQHSALKYIHLGKEELLDVFEKLLDVQSIETLRREAEAIKSAFYKFVNPNNRLEDDSAIQTPPTDEETVNEKIIVDETEEHFKALYNEYKRRRIEHIQQLEVQKEQNLIIKQGIIDELKTLLEKQEDLNHTFPTFRELQQRWRSTGPVPQTYTTNLWNTYQHYVELFYDYVKINNDLRDLDFKKNLEAKTLLCEKAEKLLIETNILTAFNKLQKYHEEWREHGPVAREYREQIWERFKAATSAINKKHQEYIESQKEEQRKNLELKQQLCEQIEAIVNTEIKNTKKWNELTIKVEELQKAWKNTGLATKKENARIFERFRTACDKFFSDKRNFYMQFKIDVQENLQKKITLCEQVENIMESTDWGKTTTKLITLQKEWKETGPVPQKHSKILWKRFRTACDTFFSRKNEHFAAIDNEYEQNLKQKEAIIAEMEAFIPSDNPVQNYTALQEFQHRWANIGFVPFKEKDRIHNSYHDVIERQFKNAKISDNEKKMIRFKSRIEDITKKNGGKIVRLEHDKLVYRLRQLESDIALWENNIGFFAKSKNADALIAEIHNKIAKAKEEIRLIEEKIKLIENQYN